MPLKIPFCFVLLLFCPLCLLAPLAFGGDESVPAPRGAENVTVMPPVTVTGVPVDASVGRSTLSAEDISRLPTGNGSLNELLKVLPSVQFSEQERSSLLGGEILPPNVSISGGLPYQNSFLIDGLGNDSLLDPSADDAESIQDVPGHPQEVFLDASLIKEVTVHRHSIPAEYGGFSGGVVESRTIDPALGFYGTFDLRTTRSQWTSFHHDNREAREIFENSNSSETQPDFEKYNGGVLINIPLSEQMGLLASYRKNYSSIPLRHFDETKNQRRELETYFVKYLFDVSARTSLSLSLLHNPYEDRRFREETLGSEIKDSWYTLKGGGTRFAASLIHDFDFAKIEVDGAWRESENSRRSPQHYRNWRIRPASWLGEWDKDWGTRFYSKEGGYGDVDTTQDAFSLKADLAFSPFTTGVLNHQVKLGYGYDRIQGSYERDEVSYVYTALPKNVDASIVCGDDTADCIDGQQYLSFRSVYDPDSVNVTINNQFLYLQDQVQFGRLMLRPGVRVSHDNFMENTDVAPRLASSLDLWGNGNTLLLAGWNRYFGKTLLTYKLAEAKKPVRSERRSKDKLTNTLSAWDPIEPKTKRYQVYSRLKTPRSDEVAFGIDQALLGGRLHLHYVTRKGRDEFAHETSLKNDDGEIFSTLNNNGKSRHEEYGLAWERGWRRHALALNATCQKSTASNSDYDDLLEEEQLAEKVYYHGRFIDKTDLPKTDFNRAYIANVVYSVSLPAGFSFTNVARYRSGHTVLQASGEKINGPGDEAVAIYRKEKQPESWLFDWKIDWRKALYREQELLLSLEINNVFNQKVLLGESDDTYEMGRQFWAGVEYRF